jgi:hypothetical protein
MAASMSLSKAAAKPAVAKTARDFAKAKPAHIGVEPAAKPAKSAKLAKSLQEAGAAGSFDGVSDSALQEILAAAVHEYGTRMEEGGDFKPFPARRLVTATDVMVSCTAMLKAVGLQIFALGMWLAWSVKNL